MFRRTLFTVALIVLAFVCAAPSAVAFETLWSQPVDTSAQLTTCGRGPIIVSSDEGVGASSLVAASYLREGGALLDETVLVSDVAGLENWYVAGDGLQNVTVVWKAAGVVTAKRVDLATGATLYGPVGVCSDAAVAIRRGAGAVATLSGVAADGEGGVYVWCTARPTSSVAKLGDTLLNHVSSSGALAALDPGLAVPRGTVKGMAVDADAHAVVLLGAPGRTGLAVQRYSPALAAMWKAAVAPYNPLFGPPPTTKPQTLGITASTSAIIAWREGGKVKAQRFSRAGSRLWLKPASLAMAGSVKLAADGDNGCYLAGPSGAGVVVRHVLSTGAQAISYPSSLPSLGLTQPRVDAVTANDAGDLTVAYSDAAVPTAAKAGLARVTCTGAWSTPLLAAAPRSFAAAAQNGAGGAYVVSRSETSSLLHLADAAATVTLRPRIDLVRYGRTILVAGYVTGDQGSPAARTDVAVGRTDASSPAAEASSASDGLYKAWITPKTNGTWTARTSTTTSAAVLIRVMPRITMTLSHVKAGTRLTEIFSGAVAPRHPGQRLLIKKRTPLGWRVVASGRLDSRSRFHIRWLMPYRTATYRVRAVLPAHADHAEGFTPTARIRVVIRRR